MTEEAQESPSVAAAPVPDEEYEVKEEVGDQAHPDDVINSSNPDAELKDLQEALSEAAENGDLPAGVSSLLGRVGLYLGAVSEQIKVLGDTVEEMHESQERNFDELSSNLTRLCGKMGVRVPYPAKRRLNGSATDPPAGKSSSQKGGTRARDEENGGDPHHQDQDRDRARGSRGHREGSAASSSSRKGRSSSKGTTGESSSSSKRSHRGERRNSEVVDPLAKYPHLVVLGTTGTSGAPEPWDPSYKFSFKVGDVVFDSMEQALVYVKYAYMKRPDLAARVKKSETPADLAHAAGILGTNEDWDGRVRDVAMSLLQLKIMQSKEFEEKVQAADPEKTYILASKDPVFGCGLSRPSLLSHGLPDKYPGKNQYGAWLKEFIERYGLGLPDDLPFEGLKKLCTFEPIELNPGKEAVLVLGDVNLSGFAGRHNTKLVCDPTMCAVAHPRDDKHTAKSVLEGMESVYVGENCRAIVLLFGTYEVGKGPDKLEADYAALIKEIRRLTPDAGIFITTALPRTDKYQDQVKMTNYAIGIAARTCDDPKVHLVDLHEKFVKLSTWKNCLRPNGFQINLTGAEKLAEMLTYALPFLSLSAPPKPSNGEVGGSNPASGGGGGERRESSGRTRSDSGSYRVRTSGIGGGSGMGDGPGGRVTGGGSLGGLGSSRSFSGGSHGISSSNRGGFTNNSTCGGSSGSSLGGPPPFKRGRGMRDSSSSRMGVYTRGASSGFGSRLRMRGAVSSSSYRGPRGVGYRGRGSGFSGTGAGSERHFNPAGSATTTRAHRTLVASDRDASYRDGAPPGQGSKPGMVSYGIQQNQSQQQHNQMQDSVFSPEGGNANYNSANNLGGNGGGGSFNRSQYGY